MSNEFGSGLIRTIHSIALSGQCSSGKSTLGKMLCQHLNWEHFNIGTEFRKIAIDYNLKIENFGSVPTQSLLAIDEKIQCKLKVEQNKIWDGRLACYLARNQQEIFKIYCIAELDVRAMRSAKREKISFERAKKEIIARDEEEKEVFMKLYGFEVPYNKDWVDLTLDTSLSPKELTEKVLKAIKPLQ